MLISLFGFVREEIRTDKLGYPRQRLSPMKWIVLGRRTGKSAEVKGTLRSDLPCLLASGRGDRGRWTL